MPGWRQRKELFGFFDTHVGVEKILH